MTTISALTIVTYLSAWDAAARRLSVDLLLIPVGDPRKPLTEGWTTVPPGPSFCETTLEVVAHLGADPSTLPTLADVPASTHSSSLTPPSTARSIFDELALRYSITAPPVAPKRAGSATLKKYLPTSYRSAFGFTGPSTELAVVDDSYHCARRCPPKDSAPVAPWSPEMSWGDLFASLLRSPAIARAAGLIHRVELELDAPPIDGGWLFFTLSSGSPFSTQAAADPNFLRIFGTRVPALEEQRPVFTAVLFPIVADASAAGALGPLDEVFPEAALFDDGFTKIVHASQARTADHAEDGDESFALPLKDMGVRLGWDDESLVVRLDRALSETKLDGSPLALAPTGAAGYRVDVRRPGTTSWSSLTRVHSEGISLGAALVPESTGELMVEVHPSQIGNQFWVPSHATFWRGGSLVAETDAERRIQGDDLDAPRLHLPLDAEDVPLRYGRDYEFRVRMVDAVGGGPLLQDFPKNVGPAPVGQLRFRRYVPLGSVQVTSESDHDVFSVQRPRIGYPQAVFAGAVDATTRLARRAEENAAAGKVEPLGVPDPDATSVEVRVLVLMPRFDPSAESSGYREVYRTTRHFPPLDADGEETSPLQLELSWIDCDRCDEPEWDTEASAGPVAIPTGRGIRIEVRALAQENDAYFGDPRARHGEVAVLPVRPQQRRVRVEAPLFAPRAIERALTSIYLQPDWSSGNPSLTATLQPAPSPALVTRLALSTDLVEDDGVLLGDPGRRVVFGCRGLKHVIAPDFSSVQLTAWAELPRRWINVLRLELARDWSWLGYATDPIRVTRRIRLVGTSVVRTEDLGVFGIQHTISQHSRQGDIDRESFEFCLIDAFDDLLGPDGFPYELEVNYRVRATLENGSTQEFDVTSRLPVTRAPRQIPRVVSTGHAFSEYRVLGDYEETGVRDRALWIEFAEPLEDPRDSYFARAVHLTPDPLLLPATEPLADPPSYEERLLDPELVRVVRPGQPRDFAGLNALQRLIPCETPAGEKPRHFLLRPPPSLSSGSPELFGFFTYEFVVGHDRGPAEEPFWVTAQGRFGTPLVLEGVQHPAPPLPLFVTRDRARDQLLVSSEYARAIHDGQILSPPRPNTEIWVVTYARVVQADGASFRNIQIGRRLAAPERRGKNKRGGPAAVKALAAWTNAELRAALEEVGLPQASPLTFLAIELLPEPNSVFDDPVGGDLGEVRVLRTSRLVSAGDGCCG